MQFLMMLDTNSDSDLISQSRDIALLLKTNDFEIKCTCAYQQAVKFFCIRSMCCNQLVLDPGAKHRDPCLNQHLVFSFNFHCISVVLKQEVAKVSHERMLI